MSEPDAAACQAGLAAAEAAGPAIEARCRMLRGAAMTQPVLLAH